MKIAYVEKLRLSEANKNMLLHINEIIEEYSEQGYTLTLRQLYYQLVSRDIIPNKQSEYSKLSTLLTKGRMAGVVDWEAIEDRLRVPTKPSSWESPAEILDSVVNQYRKDRLEGQQTYIEVWVEKDALSSVLKRATEPFGCYLMVNRGYSSTSAMHDAYQRFEQAWNDNKQVVVLYLGDHDPSGIDMVRDIRDRVNTFKGYELDEDEFEVKRIALTMEQIEKYNPPPNPAKVTDPRATEYIKKHGRISWELDALSPQVLNSLVESQIKTLIDEDLYESCLDKESEERQILSDFKKELEESE